MSHVEQAIVLRGLVAVLMAVHGLGHVVGFVAAWRLSLDPTTRRGLGGDRIALGAGGIRVIAALWLAHALLFAIAAAGTMVWATWWPWAAVTVAGSSLLLCLAWGRDARLGAMVDLVILAISIGFGAG